ncbi:MAG TPA: DNA-processing protein DprA [Gammaproteobacteria bacterium]|nr:DNA-processing protein DprA [Gammaproteobacteria bacterium]
MDRGADDAALRVRTLAALLRAPGVGEARLRRLLDEFGSPLAIARAGRARLRAAGLPESALRASASSAAAEDLQWASAPGHHLVAWGEAAYPPLLAAIPDPPPLLFVVGDPAVLADPQIAIVGSRNPSADGRDIAREFAAFLAGAGFTVTSGLALGIDAAAHAGALDADGATIAVMATGPEQVYPRRHEELAQRIAAKGALTSEFPPGTPPLPEHFPRRNRIISGLASATVVIEAALGSGSLITARLAAEQGREVFAVPGSIHSPLARGCHALIREGATLVERPSDILESLGAFAPASAAEEPREPDSDANADDPDYRAMLDALGFHPVSADTLGERTGLTPQAISSMLLILELRGEIEALPGARYARRRRGQEPK